MDVDPFDELRRRLGGDEAADRRPDARKAAVGLAGVVVIAAIVVLGAAARRPATPADDQAMLPSETTIPASPPSSTTTEPAAARVWPTEPVDIFGTEVRTGGHRWSVGTPGDLVAVGDWDCDGTATPAVVRPSTGRLHLFDGWATPEAAIRATPGPAVPADAAAFEPAGCGQATIRTTSGESLRIATTAASDR